MTEDAVHPSVGTRTQDLPSEEGLRKRLDQFWRRREEETQLYISSVLSHGPICQDASLFTAALTQRAWAFTQRDNRYGAALRPKAASGKVGLTRISNPAGKSSNVAT